MYDWYANGSEATIKPRKGTNIWCPECDGSLDYNDLIMSRKGIYHYKE